MTKSGSASTPHDHIDRLRREAERIISGRPADAGREIPPSDILDLIHELEVHQIELRIQNEELLRSRDDLSALHQTYRELYENAPCGFLTLDGDAVITRINSAASLALSKDERPVLNVSIYPYLDSSCHDTLHHAMLSAGGTGLRQVLELMVAGSGRWLRLDLESVKSEEGAARGFRAGLVDITREKEDARAQQTYRHRLRALARELEESEDRQRREIADDLHDGVGQALAVAKLNLSCLGKSLASPDEQERLAAAVTLSLTWYG